jgi:transposase, IS5 family
VFFEPYRAHFSPVLGRPSIPIETYLRMMFLKHRYRLGYESLCREVADSISWSRFCRIPLGTPVPHPSTLGKVTARCGADVIDQLNTALLARAAAAKVVRTDRVRADTTVVPANVAYPTDSGLLVQAIALIMTLVARIHAAGASSRTHVRDRRRSAGRLASAVEDLEVVLGRAGRVIDQARTRLAGTVPASATRLVSLHDVDARPIAKGRLGKPVEFGYKAQVVDNTDGIVLDHGVHRGNPADAPLLVPAITRIKTLLGRAPTAVTADRGYGEAKVDDELTDLGVKHVVIPRKGKPSAARRATEHGRGFRRLVKWRTGCEGRISYLKRRYGLDRTRLDGLDGARTWCGLGVLTHNTVKIAHLIESRQTGRATPAGTSASQPAPQAPEATAPGPRAGPKEPATTTC